MEAGSIAVLKHRSEMSGGTFGPADCTVADVERLVRDGYGEIGGQGRCAERKARGICPRQWVRGGSASNHGGVCVVEPEALIICSPAKGIGFRPF